jgi:hypothetical protein
MLALDADALGRRNGSMSWRKHVKDRCDTIFKDSASEEIKEALALFLNAIAAN